MAFMVRAIAAGPWRTVDRLDGVGMQVGVNTLLLCLEESGKWCVDQNSVDVYEGLVVSFMAEEDAVWFLQSGRGTQFAVEQDQCIDFAKESDAAFFVSKGLAEWMTPAEADEVRDMRRRHREAYDNVEDEVEVEEEEKMQTPKMENKAVTPAKQTKAAKPAAKSAKRK